MLECAIDRKEIVSSIFGVADTLTLVAVLFRSNFLVFSVGFSGFKLILETQDSVLFTLPNLDTAMTSPAASFKFVETSPSTVLAESVSPGTKKTTQSHVRFFRKYLEEIRGQTQEESDKWYSMQEEDLVKHLKEFFAGIKKQKDGSDLQPTYLWNIFSSIQRELRLQSASFCKESVLEVGVVLKAVCKELKARGEGSQPYAKDELTQAEVSTLFDEQVAGPHNPRALQNGIAIVMIFMGVRGDTELYNLCLGDLSFKTIDGVKHLVLDKERITKTRQGTETRNIRELPKLPELPQQPDRCPVRLFQKFLLKRPQLFNSAESKLLVRPSTTLPRLIWPETEKWYINSPMGVREVGQIVKKMVAHSTIDTTGRQISNTSLRKFLDSTLLRHKVSGEAKMNQMGHKSRRSINRYDCTSVESSNQIARALFGGEDEPGPSTSEATVEIKPDMEPGTSSKRRADTEEENDALQGDVKRIRAQGSTIVINNYYY